MSVKSSTQGWPQASDIAVQTATPMFGGASREDLQTVVSSADSQTTKLFQDRNTQLADGGTLSYVSGSPDTLTMTTTFKLHLNFGTPVVKTITGTSFDFTADGRMLYVVLDNRTGDSTLSGGNVVADSATLPAVNSSNQEVILIAKRIGNRVYFRNGQSLGNGESTVLGSAAVNPSFSDAIFEIFDNTTPTKIMKFETSGLTGTNIFTPPPATDTLAGLGTAQTFSAINTFSAQMKISDGSVTEPSIVFSSDDDATGTGIYRVTANSLGFAANGTAAGNYSATTAWTLGISTGLGAGASAYHFMNGTLLGRSSSSSTGTWTLGQRAGLDVTTNIYRDGAGARKAVETATGTTAVSVRRDNVSSGPVFFVDANFTDAQTADAALVTTNEQRIISGTAGGGWTFGFTGAIAGSQTHLFQSGGVTAIRLNAGNGSSDVYHTLSQAGTIAWAYGYSNGNNRFEWYQGTSGFGTGVLAGHISATGVWTLGPGDAVGGSLTHVVGSGATTSLRVRAGAGASNANIILNRTGTENAYLSVVGTNDTIVTGSLVGDFVLANTNTGSGRIIFSNTGSGIWGTISNTGAWTLGPSTGGGPNLIRGGDEPLHVRTNSGSLCSIVFETSTTVRGYLTFSNTSAFTMYNGALGVMASATSDGAWTFGGSGTTTVHRMGVNSTSEDVLQLRNHQATTGSDPIQALTIIKGSTTNTSAQKLVAFIINAGATAQGAIVGNGANAAAFGTLSDSRLKENVEDLPSQLDNIMALRPVEFDYLDGSGHQIGFIAQEMQTVYPDAVAEGTTPEAYMEIGGWSKTEARLVKAIQELKALNDALEARIAALEA